MEETYHSSISKTYKYDLSYMEVAHVFANLSHDTKHRVGAVVVRDGQILSQGWNGMVAGMPNKTRTSNGLTRPEVVHAEANAIAKLAKNGGGSEGATIYCTHSPCFHCATLILQSGIGKVIYEQVYDKKAIKFLIERGINIERLTERDDLSHIKGK